MAGSNQADKVVPLSPLAEQRGQQQPDNEEQQDDDDISHSARCCDSPRNLPPTVNSDPRPVIDNSRNIYLPTQLRCGVTVLCRPEAIMHCPQVLQDLNSDLQQCLQLLPWSVHNLIRRTRIWINLTYQYGHCEKPVSLSHSTAHHHVGWLLWARDRPEKALGIEIYNCRDYRKMRLHWNGCGLILHELCHLIHQQVLVDGLENIRVKRVFARAQKSGLYERILRRDWAGKDVDYDMAYAMVDWKEFFAEMSVTYFSQGYRELAKEDRHVMERSSPPLCEPTVLSRIRQKKKALGLKGQSRLEGSYQDGSDCFRPFEFIQQFIQSTNRELRHCNKFYPFTRSQLQLHDPYTFGEIDALWKEIRYWDDPMSDPPCSKPINCWNPWKRRSCSDTIEL